MTSIYIETYGCSLNRADSEQMAGLLKEAKFEILGEIEEADIVIINTCTVKGPTETNFFHRLGEIKEKYPYKIVIIAGCLAQTEAEKLEGYPLVGTKQIHKIVEVVEEALNENIICNLDFLTKAVPPLETAKIRKNLIVEIIPICRGCLGHCSYCRVRAARGRLVSYPVMEIKNRAEKAIKEGAKEIWLTAQDCGAYGQDIGANLAELVLGLADLAGDFRIRVGMMNPNHLKEIKGKLIEAYKSEKVFKFLHLPVQSGSNEILKRMKRKYTKEEFLEIVREFRRNFPELTLSTDVIVGFPGESEEQYWETLNLVREINPDVLNISRFWARPGTPAAEMKEQVPGGESKRRSGVLAQIFNNIALMQNEKWQSWEGEIVIDEKGKERDEKGKEKDEKGKEKDEKGKEKDEKGKERDDKGKEKDEKGKEGNEKNKEGNPGRLSPAEEKERREEKAEEETEKDYDDSPQSSGTSNWLGRNYAYKQVVVEGEFKLGDKVKVRIEKVTPFDLRGKVVG